MLSLFTLPAIYLLGMLFTAAVTARPIRRIMGAGTDSDHAATMSARRINTIIALLAAGFAALWPVTMPVYLARRFISASEDDRPSPELIAAQRYSAPVK